MTRWYLLSDARIIGGVHYLPHLNLESLQIYSVFLRLFPYTFQFTSVALGGGCSLFQASSLWIQWAQIDKSKLWGVKRGSFSAHSSRLSARVSSAWLCTSGKNSLVSPFLALGLHGFPLSASVLSWLSLQASLLCSLILFPSRTPSTRGYSVGGSLWCLADVQPITCQELKRREDGCFTSTPSPWRL